MVGFARLGGCKDVGNGGGIETVGLEQFEIELLTQLGRGVQWVRQVVAEVDADGAVRQGV